MPPSPEDKICLTLASSGLGSATLHHLLHTLKIPPRQLILADLPSDVTVRRADYEEPESLESAFAGATKVILISYPKHCARGEGPGAYGRDRCCEEGRLLMDSPSVQLTYAQAGVRHVYYTSLAFSDPSTPPGPSDSRAAVMQAHIDTEAYLKEVCARSEGRMTYTIIREGIYAESYPLYLRFFDEGVMAKDRRVVIPGQGGPGVAWVTKLELAEGTARIVCEEGGKAFKGETVLLSGARAYTLAETAGLLSEALGWKAEPLKVEAVGKEEYVEHMFARQARAGTNPPTREFLRQWTSTYTALERGDTAVVDELLERILGRSLMGMGERLGQVLDDRGNDPCNKATISPGAGRSNVLQQDHREKRALQEQISLAP